MLSHVSRYLSDNNKKLIRFFIFSYYLLSFAFFLCPIYPAYLVIFYLCAGLPGLVLVLLDKPRWLTHPVLLTIYVFLLYGDITLLMNVHDDPYGCFDLLKKTFITIGFVWMGLLFFTSGAREERYVTYTFYWMLIATPLAFISHFHKGEGLYERLDLFAQAHHPIIGANVYGVFGLFALYRLLTRRFEKKSLLYIAVIACVCTLIFFTQSKGPMLAIAGSYFMLLFLFLSLRWRCIMGMIVLAVVALGCFYFMSPHTVGADDTSYLALMERRGLSDRLPIWNYASELIKQRPWFGHGLDADFQFELFPHIYIYHPHSIYMATLYYTGIVGLVLELLIFATLGWAITTCKDMKWKCFAFSVVAYLLLSMVSDVARLVASPKDLLFMFWLPFLIITSHIINEKREVENTMQAQPTP